MITGKKVEPLTVESVAEFIAISYAKGYADKTGVLRKNIHNEIRQLLKQIRDECNKQSFEISYSNGNLRVIRRDELNAIFKKYGVE